MSWNRPGESVKSLKQKKHSARRILVLAILALLISAGYFTYMLNREPNVEDPKETRQDTNRIIKTEVPKVKLTQADAKVEKKEEWDDKYLSDNKKRLKFSQLFETKTNSVGVITERFKLPNGKTWRRVTDPPPIFTNAAEVTIMRSIGDASGSPIPPVPGLDDANLDEEFVKSLSVQITINPNDSPNVAATKMLVKEIKSEIDSMYRNGEKRTVGQILQEHIDLNNHAANLRADAWQQFERVRQSDGPEFAKEYLEAINVKLEQYGIDKIDFPDETIETEETNE